MRGRSRRIRAAVYAPLSQIIIYITKILRHMTHEEIKLAQYIDELSVGHVNFTKLGDDIFRANNQSRYVIDSLAFCN